MSPRDHSRLTRRQAEILEFIADYDAANGFSPSVRDIGARFGVNPATVHDHLKALERKGYVEKKANLSRSLHVVGRDRPTARRTPGPREVPIVGRVAAGYPILAEQNIEDTVRLPDDWASDGTFLLRVAGESMRDAHILDGDLVLVRPAPTARNGEIVVAMIGDEATVKTFHRSGDDIELRPANPAFEPIRVTAEDADGFSDFKVIGTVTGVFRLGAR